jgi:lipoprotein
MRTLRNSIPLLGFAMFLLLLGCGARKVRKHKEKDDHKTEMKELVKKDSVSETQTEETANIKTLTKSLDFAIKPIGSEPVQFRFLYNGNIVEGSANGEIYFKDKKQEKDSIIKIIEKVRVEVEKQEQKQTKEQHKLTREEKQSERAENWIVYLILIIVGMFLWERLDKLIDKFK